jgi:hypothetical protein
MMNTGMILIGVMATGYIIPMDTIVFVMCGGIHGGGITIGGDAIGVTISPGISIIVGFTLSGMRVAVGGIDHVMDAGYGTGCLIPTMKYDTTLNRGVFLCLLNLHVRSIFPIKNKR